MPDPHRCGQVAIVGRPNVGKSTLLNRLIGQKLAITAHKAQTTRHSILGVKTRPGGQILYVDTPGIHERQDHALNRYLNRTARSALEGVDLVLFVVEAGRWTREDQKVLEDLKRARIPSVVAVNKIDLLRRRDDLLPFLAELDARQDFAALVPVSARKGDQVEALERVILDLLPEGPPLFPADQLSDRPERFFAAELLREQLTRRYDAEIPYRLSVEIEQFREEGNLYRIHALVWVERPAQKAILLGKGGQAMKATASRAREEMERFFGRKVHLQVWVKVRKSWSSDERALADLGYRDG